MSAYMDTPHYRVNKFASVLRVLRERAGRDPALPPVEVARVNDIKLALDDLEAVVRQAAEMYRFIKALPCPNPQCTDGSIINTGPDPQNDACEWCYMRHMLMNPVPEECTIRESSAAPDTALAELESLRRLHKRLEDAVDSVDGPEGEPRGNEASRIITEWQFYEWVNHGRHV